MKTYITLFAIILFSGSLFGQKFVQEWYIDLPGLEYYSQASAIISTHDDHLFIAGPNNTNSSIGSMFFMETDTAGNVIQLTSAEEQFSSTNQIANSLIEDRNNNFVMAGGFNDLTYFTKLSSEGEVLNTTADGAQFSYQGGYDVEQTLDDGYLITAQNAIYGTGRCLALRKLDSLGSFIWDMTFLHPDNITPIVGIFSRMDKIDDSTFVITGKRNYAPGSGEDLDILLCKIRVWNNSIQMLNLTVFQQDGSNEQGHDILVLPDNQGYIICGTGQNESLPQYTDGIIMRIGVAGNLIWKKSYTRALYSNTSFLRVLADEQENILVLAQTSAGSGDVSLLKYSLDGDLLQKQHFDTGVNETAYDMAISQNGKIFLSAGTLYYGDHPRALLLKVQDVCPVTNPEAALTNNQPDMGDDVVVSVPNTNSAWSYSLIQINGEITLSTFQGNGGTVYFTESDLANEDVLEGMVVSVIEPGADCIKYSDTLYLEFVDGIEDRFQNSLQIFPNPFQHFIIITDIENNKLSKLAVFNMNGQIIIDKLLMENYQKINLSKLPKGKYLFRVTYQTGETVYRKVIRK